MTRVAQSTLYRVTLQSVHTTGEQTIVIILAKNNDHARARAEKTWKRRRAIKIERVD